MEEVTTKDEDFPTKELVTAHNMSQCSFYALSDFPVSHGRLVKDYQTCFLDEDCFDLVSSNVACALLLYGNLDFESTVEPLTNDHPHQRPSLSYDHISCDGQWFLFVYESLTSDHPSYTTTPM